MDIDWIRYNMDDLSDFLKTRVEHAVEVSALMMKTIKRISFSVSAEMLSEIGLNENLRWLCQEFSILHKIPCSYESSLFADLLSEEMQIDFFRICQEALQNVAMHAHAKNVHIKTTQVGQPLTLTVTDDGIGFDVAAQKENFGLTQMRERASSINGWLNVESVLGKGTSVSVSVDLPLTVNVEAG
ncbi:MAG: ATP-binding protein [Ferruginibacter sp.]|nr:ATP-binding protein [Ferruginibacter sp.]